MKRKIIPSVIIKIMKIGKKEKMMMIVLRNTNKVTLVMIREKQKKKKKKKKKIQIMIVIVMIAALSRAKHAQRSTMGKKDVVNHPSEKI